MSVLPHNFELLPSLTATSGQVFGIGQDVSCDADGFAPGSTDWAVQDAENPQNGTTAFGRDRLLGPRWTWQLHLNREDEYEAMETLNEFVRAWHALHIRDTPGRVIPLRYEVGGRVRRVLGRPGRCEYTVNNLLLSGFAPVSVDFKCVDGFTYDDEPTVVSMQLGAELDEAEVDTGGGFIFPVTFPVVTLPPTRQITPLRVGGTAPAAPVVRFQGPVVNPRVVTPHWTLGLDMTIPDGQYVEIDCNPWAFTAMLNGNASVAGRLLRRQRLAKVRFQPGETFQARYTGYSSGVSTCTITWRNTHDAL